MSAETTSMQEPGPMDPISKALERAEQEHTINPPGSAESVREWVRPTTGLGARAFDFSMGRIARLSEEHLRKRHILCDPQTDDKVVADRYRLLRTRILQMMRGRGWRHLGITSTAPKAGKTLTAINLAISIAREGGHKVVLVDADIRKPTLATDLGIEIENGFIDYLTTDLALADVMYRFEEIPNLQVIPGRMAPKNAAMSEILTSKKLRNLVEQLNTTNEPNVVLVDMPPALVGDDVIALAERLDALVLVVDEGGTQMDELTKTVELLKNFNVIGTVLNKSSEKVRAMEGYYQLSTHSS